MKWKKKIKDKKQTNKKKKNSSNNLIPCLTLPFGRKTRRRRMPSPTLDCPVRQCCFPNETDLIPVPHVCISRQVLQLLHRENTIRIAQWSFGYLHTYTVMAHCSTRRSSPVQVPGKAICRTFGLRLCVLIIF